MLDDIPRTMPARPGGRKLGSRAAKVGFDWPDTDGLFDKLQEEIAELQAELPTATASAPRELRNRRRVRRPSLHRSQPRPSPATRSRVRPPCRQRQVPPPLLPHGSSRRRSQRPGDLAPPSELDELWSTAKNATVSQQIGAINADAHTPTTAVRIAPSPTSTSTSVASSSNSLSGATATATSSHVGCSSWPSTLAARFSALLSLNPVKWTKPSSASPCLARLSRRQALPPLPHAGRTPRVPRLRPRPQPQARPARRRPRPWHRSHGVDLRPS